MSAQKSISIYTLGWILLFGVLLYFPIFHFLDQFPIRIWDESLFGLRAISLLASGDYMFDFSEFGLPDHRNTKLPFTTWTQVLSMKLMGINTLAMRLPISLIFIGTVAFILRYSKKHLGSISIGVIFTLVLICSPGIVRNHMLRSGEHDMPLVCYLIVAVVSYYQYLQYHNKKYLWLFTIAMIAAFLTKNLLAGVILPGMLIYTIYACKLKSILTDKNIWLSIMLIIGSYLATIGYLEYQSEGFIDRMWNYELGGRYSEAKDGHKGNIWYFVKDLSLTHFRIYFWLVLIALILLRDPKLSPAKKQLITYLGVVFISYILIISFAKTKLFWYGMPATPVGALIIGIALHHYYFQHMINWSNSKRYLIVSIFITGAFLVPYGQMIQHIMNDNFVTNNEKFGPFMERLSYDHPNIKTFTLADNIPAYPSTFCREKYNLSDQGYKIKSAGAVEFAIGDTVATCIYSIYDQSNKKYDIEMIQIWEDCFIYVIKGNK